MIFSLCIFLAHLFVLQASADLALEHSFFASLDEDENVKLYWNVSTANKEILFTVEAKTTGWIGFGISSGQGKMKGADIVIGWVKDGKPYFKVSKYELKGIRFTQRTFFYGSLLRILDDTRKPDISLKSARFHRLTLVFFINLYGGTALT